MRNLHFGGLAFVLSLLSPNLHAQQSALADVREPLNIIVLTSNGGVSPLTRTQLKKYGDQITSAWGAYARGRRQWHVDPDRNIFGPINVDAFHPNCDSTMSNSALEASIAPLLQQLQGQQKIILHFHTCGFSGSYSTNSHFYTYFHFHQTIPTAPGDGGLPGVSVITREAMRVQATGGDWGFGNDGIYLPSHDFLALGPGLPYTDYSINGSPYSIMGQGQNSLLPLAKRLPSAANLDINNRLSGGEKVTFQGGVLSVRLYDYTAPSSANHLMVARIPYWNTPPLPQNFPLPQTYVYLYYRRSVGKFVLGYGPVPSGSTYYGVEHQVAETEVTVGATGSWTIQHVPLFGNRSIQVEMTNVDPRLEWVDVTIRE